jgi:hypothetical protein
MSDNHCKIMELHCWHELTRAQNSWHLKRWPPPPGPKLSPKESTPARGKLGPKFRSAGEGGRHDFLCGFAVPSRPLNSVLESKSGLL